MKYHHVLLALSSFCYVLLITPSNTYAQTKCATTEFALQQYKKNPTLIKQRKQLEEKVQSYLNSQKKFKKKEQLLVTIPVVFHVLYKNEARNIDIDEFKINSQIEVLNKDFRRLNDDATNVWPQAADPQIEFCLANIDVNGNYFEGVTRTQTPIEYFEYANREVVFSSELGGKDIWPGYLNIYVCDLNINDLSGAAGFSSFPGYDASIDGIALDYRATGTFGELTFSTFGGRTATHEVGHWLNLEHLWGPENTTSCAEDDGVMDTPQSENPYFDCNSGSSCGSVDMVENFMDYHDDFCMNLFTQGQVDRMHASIEVAPSRAFLKNHTKCESCYTQINVSYLFDNVERMIQASNHVTAENSIENQSDITYFAGDSIVLNNGFNVNTGNAFLADIQACVN